MISIKQDSLHRCELILALIVFAIATVINAQPASTETAGITAAVEGFHRALVDGNRAAVLAMLAPDAVILESGDKQTRAEYEREHLPEDITFARTTTTTSSAISVQVQGDVAWTVATTQTTGTFNGREVNSAGVEMMVLTKTAEGWRIRAIHWSSHKSRELGP